jgi:capsular exopolysaccharide synthesis family protein
MPGKDGSVPHVLLSPEQQELDLHQWLKIFWEHRLWILGVTGTLLILTALYSFLATPIYSATATVYVQSYSRQPIGTVNTTGVGSWTEEQKFYNSQAEIIKSRSIMQEVVDRLDLLEHEGFKGSKDPARILQGMVRVEEVRDSALFRITVSTRYKKDVALWANTVAEVYRDKTLRDALDYVAKANEMMLEEARKMQESYVRQQSQLASQLSSTGSYFPENQKDILDKRIEALELKLNDVSVRESEVSAVVGQVRAALNRGDETASLPSTSQDPTLQDMTRQYNEMTRDLSKLTVKFTPEHPEVKALKSRIARQGQSILSTYQTQLAAIWAEKGNLQAELDGAKKQGLQFVEGASRGQVMTTSAESIKKYMDLLYDKMQELNVAGSLLSSNIRIVNPAISPGGPVKPNKTRNLALALFIGLMLSMGSVVAFRYLDTTVKSVDDIEKELGLNLLSMVPIITEETKRPAFESFQTLRTALIYASQNQQKNVILITSATPQEGKTTVITNLAKTLASAGERILVVDCDLRRPALSRCFEGNVQAKGLTNYLAARDSKIEEFVSAGGQPNLYVLGSGPVPPNPPELFGMKRFKELLDQFRKEYAWVLVDSPPCLSITDAQILAGMCDCVVLVARYAKSQKPMLERAVVTLKRLEANVAGVVLNHVETYSTYYYDYYLAHHYYYETGEEPRRKGFDVSRIGQWRELFKVGAHASKKVKKHRA